MIELIIALLALTALIMFSGMIKRGIEKLGTGIGSVGGAASHLVEAGADQAIRARITSNDSLQDTKLASSKMSAERAVKRTAFTDSLSDTQKTEVDTHQTWLDSL